MYTGNDIGLLNGISIEIRPDSTHTGYSFSCFLRPSFLDLCDLAHVFHRLAFAELCLLVLLEHAHDIMLTLLEALYLLHDEGSKKGMELAGERGIDRNFPRRHDGELGDYGFLFPVGARTLGEAEGAGGGGIYLDLRGHAVGTGKDAGRQVHHLSQESAVGETVAIYVGVRGDS